MISLNKLIFAMTLLTGLGCALMAGVFFAFSSFVMKGLSRLPADQGIAAMQSINAAVTNSWFLAVFLGTSIASFATAVLAIWQWSNPAAVFLLVGGIIYLTGAFLVTMVFNVPLNESLASLSPTAPDRSVAWTAYLTHWTIWNHVRTIACTAATALLMLGLD
jgi:uncharacterized membrane protein